MSPRVGRLENARPGNRTARHVRLAGADPDQVRILVGYRYDEIEEVDSLSKIGFQVVPLLTDFQRFPDPEPQ